MDPMMDFSTVCRTCLGTNALNPIFASNEDHKRHATDVFIATGIKVVLNDGLPQQMCLKCANFIKNSILFRRQCKDTENKLLQIKEQSTNNIEKYETFIDLKVECMKTELDCELKDTYYTHSVKPKYESDLENIPLSCIAERKQNGGREVPEEIRSEKVIENRKCNKKNKVLRVSCPVCQKELSPRSLRAHVAHHGLQCAYCKLEHSSKEALAAHTASCPLKKKRRVSETGKQLVSCEVCHKAMQRGSLRAHLAVTHRGLRPVCEHCGRRFGNKLRLSEHLRAKHGHEKLRCSHCEFQSASQTALQNHERRHRGEKPYVCETCGAKFHAAYLLAQHRHSHRTEKRIKCGLCGASFKALNSLHTHRAARHGARRHRCPLCARVYACRHYAVKHLRAVHGFKGTVPPLQVDPSPS